MVVHREMENGRGVEGERVVWVRARGGGEEGGAGGDGRQASWRSVLGDLENHSKMLHKTGVCKSSLRTAQAKGMLHAAEERNARMCKTSLSKTPPPLLPGAKFPFIRGKAGSKGGQDRRERESGRESSSRLEGGAAKPLELVMEGGGYDGRGGKLPQVVVGGGERRGGGMRGGEVCGRLRWMRARGRPLGVRIFRTNILPRLYPKRTSTTQTSTRPSPCASTDKPTPCPTTSMRSLRICEAKGKQVGREREGEKEASF